MHLDQPINMYLIPVQKSEAEEMRKCQFLLNNFEDKQISE